MSSRTIVFVHGNFVTRRCWEPWIARLTPRGYTCHALEYPLRDGSVAELRAKHPDPALGRLGLPEVLAHHVEFIQRLPEKPIIIGHSFGGFLTQLLVQRDLAASAVAIDAVPPQGVLTTEFSFFKSLWPVVNPLIPASKPYLMSFPEWQYTFVHNLPLAEQKAAYEEHVVPESRLLGRGALTSLGKIDFTRAHAPLLLVAGSVDKIMPASLVRAVHKRYAASPSIAEYKEFPDRAHHILNQRGWEEVADFVVEWASARAGVVGEPALVG